MAKQLTKKQTETIRRKAHIARTKMLEIDKIIATLPAENETRIVLGKALSSLRTAVERVT